VNGGDNIVSGVMQYDRQAISRQYAKAYTGNIGNNVICVNFKRGYRM
jgi:hypothetical protein